MSGSRTAYTQLRTKAVLDLLDQFPNTPTLTLARICYRDNKQLYSSVEDARGIIRRYRGASGIKNRQTLKNRKYVRQQK